MTTVILSPSVLMVAPCLDGCRQRFAIFPARDPFFAAPLCLGSAGRLASLSDLSLVHHQAAALGGRFAKA